MLGKYWKDLKVDNMRNIIHILRIDTIIREGVADGKQLVSPNAPMIVYDFIHQSELMDMFHLQ